MMLTRRQFLQRTSAFAALFGIGQGSKAEAASAPPSLTALAAGSTLGLPDEAPLLGRLFSATQVRAKPQATAKALKRLPADSLHAIQGVSSDGWWYQIADGYLPREAMQPILPYERPPHPTELHTGYYEVIAPITTLRRACSPYAELVGRYPFGTVLYVHDWLTDDARQTWYALSLTADGRGAFGWASALHFRRWLPQPSPLRAPALWLEVAQQSLSLYEGEAFVGKTAVHSGNLPPDSGTLRVRLPCARASEPPHLHMWQMLLQPRLGKPVPFYAANWHNRFGTPNTYRAVELPIFAARWLYNMLGGAPMAEIPVVIG
ncbi:MAG: twin-arginine translocation signal domain-containing protein [Chloroflexi bacterium CFX4]|nr:twin-arginine translocation signal domain-containing protein [Chloroflexi bacterium CFX4]MDL1923110.1 twin-arginine translocation signal domain-containing protein [Chloroflexi bacterium CFX3]